MCDLCGQRHWDWSFADPHTPCPQCGWLLPDVTTRLVFGQFNTDALALIPESVARVEGVLGFAGDEKGLIVAGDLQRVDREVRDKLRFILNRRIDWVHAEPFAIVTALDRHYPRQSEGDTY